MNYETIFKVALYPHQPATLTTERLLFNLARHARTTLILDTNILIGISKFVEAYKKSPEDVESLIDSLGLRLLSDLIRSCERMSICYSLNPGFALGEIDSSSLATFMEAYDIYLEILSANTTDEVNGPVPKAIPRLHDILSLKKDDAMPRTFPYLSLCCLLTVLYGSSGETSVERYSRYLTLIDEFVGVHSYKENLIAMLALSEDKLGDVPEDLREIVLKGIANFTRYKKEAKQPTTSLKAKKVAFSGASDLLMINAVVSTNEVVVDGELCDSWLVTRDRKLSEFFTRVFHYQILEPGQYGKNPAPLPESLLRTTNDLLRVFSSRKKSENTTTNASPEDWSERVLRVHELMDRVWVCKA